MYALEEMREGWSYLCEYLGHGKIGCSIAGSSSDRDVHPVSPHVCHADSLNRGVGLDVTLYMEVIFLVGRNLVSVCDQAEYGRRSTH